METDKSDVADKSKAVFFSIVTVVRNNIDGLRRTHVALAQQTFTSWEWIIIDGASTDGTREYALGCASKDIRVVSEPDRGIYDAMNKGLRLARGSYVVFMNGGDVPANEGALAAVKADLDTDPVDILFGSSLMWFGVVTISRPARHPSYIWHGQPGLHQATFFERERHVRFPYDLSYAVCADYDAITRMAAAGARLRSSPIIVSTNEFIAEATSGGRKLQLIREAVRAQRANLQLPLAKVAASVLLRSASSVLAKALTSVDLVRRRWMAA